MSKVSIIVTLRKAKFKYLKKCLERINLQTIKPFEVIIVEDIDLDGSSVNPEELLKTCLDNLEGISFRIFNTKERVGKADQLNWGVQECLGEFIGLCSADDFYETNFIEESLKMCKDGVAFSDYNLVNNEGVFMYKYSCPKISNSIEFKMIAISQAKTNNMFCCMATWLAKSEIFKENPFDRILKENEDLEWYLRLLLVKNIKFYFTDKTLANYRVSRDQLSSSISIETLTKNNRYSMERINNMLGYKIFDI